MTFGDGSNKWIDGTIETVANPVDRVTSPYDTVAGAADAAALNFDEGVGGLTSLFDNEPGNTAGPQDEEWTPAGGLFLGEDGPLSGTGLGGQGINLVILLAVIVAVGQLFNINIGDSTE